MLNFNVYVFQSSNLGQELLDRVFKHLNLLETSYFGLRYLDHGNQTVGYVSSCNLVTNYTLLNMKESNLIA